MNLIREVSRFMCCLAFVIGCSWFALNLITFFGSIAFYVDYDMDMRWLTSVMENM